MKAFSIDSDNENYYLLKIAFWEEYWFSYTINYAAENFKIIPLDYTFKIIL